MKRLSILFISLLVGSIHLFAQQVTSLDTVLVTTSHIPLKIHQTGRNISYIEGKDLNRLPANSLDEVFQAIPGIEVQSRNGFGAQADILMRGGTFTQALILIDGMRMNDPLTAHFNGNIPVTPAEISRIEIMRGPAAAIYGPDAVGGVINIITKTFDNRQRKDMETAGNLSFGQNQLVQATQGISMRGDNFILGGGISITQSPGELIEAQQIDSTTTLEAYNNYFDVKTVGASFGARLTDRISLRARTGYDYRDFSARYFYTTSTFDKSTETTQNWWNHLQLARRGNRGFTDFNVGYKFNTDEFVFSPDFPSTNNHETRYLNMILNHSFYMRGVSFKMGIQADRRQIESNDRGNHDDLHAGAYLMAYLKPVDRMHVSASMRADYDENYGLEWLPQLNASYVFEKLVLRAATGRSIRAADYTERYVSNNLKNLTPGRSLGNPDLLAERSWSHEVGLDYYLGKTVQLKATGFLRNSDNLIDYVSTNESEIGEVGDLREGENYFFARNISEVTTQGFEVEAWYNKRIPAVGSIRLSLGYTYLNTSNAANTVSVYLSSHARQLLTTHAILRYKFLDFSMSGLYKQRNARAAEAINSNLEPSYMLWNTKVGLRIQTNIVLNLQVNNLFDIDYQNILGAPMPGRWISGGLSWRFAK